MRPLELELTAFRSYDRATVDLRAHDLVVISGDTGAGKTSLLDAISFALFGTTPERARPGDLLTLGRSHGEVRLTFAARGDVWRVHRRYGPDAPDPSHVLELLDGDGGAAVETIGGEEAVQAVLGRLLGMSFRAFTSAVLLAQGRFAEFLGAQPRERDAILRELFNVASLEGARLAAGRAQAAAEGEADGYERAAARLAEHGPRARRQAAAALRAAATRLAAARRLVPLAREAEVQDRAATAARGSAAAARDAASHLPDGAEGAELLERLAAREAAVAAAREREAATDASAAAAGRALEALRERHGGDAAALAALAVRAEDVQRLGAELPARRAALERRAAALVERTAALGELQATLAAAERRRDALAAQLSALEGCSAAEQALAAALAAERAAAADAREAAREATTADAALATAEQRARAKRRADLAAAIHADLAPGDPCPVCGGEVGAHRVVTGDVAGAEAALASARETAAVAARTQAQAQERARAASAALGVAQGAHDAAARALAESGADPGDADGLRGQAVDLESTIAAARGGVESELRAVSREESAVGADGEAIARDGARLAGARLELGPWADADDAVAALGAAIAELRAAEEAARQAVADAARAAAMRADADRALADLVAGPVARLRATAARVAAQGRLEAPAEDLAPAQLVAAAVRLRETALAAAERHERAADAADARGRRAQERLASAGAALGVALPSQVEGALRRLQGARDAVRSAHAEVERAAAEARRLRADAAAARTRGRVHGQVANDLRANNFPRFLLNRYQQRLAMGASVRLQELTNDAYRFAGTGADALAVVDMRRGERLRKAATLSGGERFLASLALALGLSDIAAESGGRLECLFLDEGFSTLDADALEQALAGIERLSGDGRLVAVITHLPGVADRLGDAIHVEKDPAGVSRVRGDAAAGVSGGAVAAKVPA